MNWGYKILVTILLFIAGIATMVTIAMRQNNDLVDDEYYVRELSHQELINADQNLTERTDGQVMLYNEKEAVAIHIPRSTLPDTLGATITFIRPEDKKKDRRFILAPDTNGVMSIPGDQFTKGIYTVRLSWKSNRIPYYHEQSFYIN